MPESDRLPLNIQGYFICRKSTAWDKRLYSPSEGRLAEDFFAQKNSTASAGFEPTNLGTKDQHATTEAAKENILSESVLCSFYPKTHWQLPFSVFRILLVPMLRVTGAREKHNFILKRS